MLEHLNKINQFSISSLEKSNFNLYGKVIESFDSSFLINQMKTNTTIPSEGNLYVASEPVLEKQELIADISLNYYGAMPIQIGYCNGKNSTVNGFEYHKGSEIIIAITDFVLCLGHTWDIKDDSYDVTDAKFFYIPQGTCLEIYQTTLHLSPIKVTDDGYKAVIILPKDTNTKLQQKSLDKTLLMTNKWVLAHPERFQLVDQGAHVGVKGQNLELKY